MRPAHILAPLVFLLCPLATAAQRSEDAPTPDTPWAKSKDGFGAVLLLTDRPNEFVEEWQSTPPDHRPTLKATARALRNKPVVAFLLFSGCSPANGVCDCSVDFRVLRPDGSTYAERNDLELWRDKPPTPGNNLQLSVANLGLVIEAEDPLGVYTIKARVKDNVAGTVLELSTSIEAVAR